MRRVKGIGAPVDPPAIPVREIGSVLVAYEEETVPPVRSVLIPIHKKKPDGDVYGDIRFAYDAQRRGVEVTSILGGNCVLGAEELNKLISALKSLHNRLIHARR